MSYISLSSHICCYSLLSIAALIHSDLNSSYMKGLRLFRFPTLVSSIQWDFQVGYVSSAITRANPYKRVSALTHWIASSPPRIIAYSNFPSEYEKFLARGAKTVRRESGFVVLSNSSPFFDGFVGLESPQAIGWKEVRVYTPMLMNLQVRSIVSSVGVRRLLLDGSPGFTHFLSNSHSPRLHPCMLNQRVPWRRIDFEIHSLFSHDAMVGKKSVPVPGFGISDTSKIFEVVCKVVELDSKFFHVNYKEEEDEVEEKGAKILKSKL